MVRSSIANNDIVVFCFGSTCASLNGKVCTDG